MDVKIHPSWKNVLSDYFQSDSFKQLAEFIRGEYQNKKIYPPAKLIFNALDLCPFDLVKVVVVGQDPYHTPGQAMGLAFSVPEGNKLQPSLQNIYKEIIDDLSLDQPIPESGDLTYLAKQGVLLLNATLTVEAHQAGSHQNMGWEEFTDVVIERLSEQREGLVFLLWGKYAKDKGAKIDRDKHLVLESAHPSPFSANNGFFGSKHFSKTNEYLESRGEIPIFWLDF
ncbi:uracil-DNA glycosylase [candidate division WWE3 bacterium]|uniref:Uracil-DNA glycosylase n=1 Tax=candidate division WWE3 bacterium TaxID=2053526 RepID=A0A955LKX7_UNCKA|nr:uracil-DNA glycosylase [candidate division WWE3 bacterium]